MHIPTIRAQMDGLTTCLTNYVTGNYVYICMFLSHQSSLHKYFVTLYQVYMESYGHSIALSDSKLNGKFTAKSNFENVLSVYDKCLLFMPEQCFFKVDCDIYCTVGPNSLSSCA